MEKSKLLIYFKSFTHEDWKWFDLFLRSPFFNRRKEMEELALYLASFAPYDKELPDKKLIHQKLFGKARYNDKQVRYALTDLTRLLEKFLAARALENDKVLMNQKLSDELLHRENEKAYAQVYRNTKELLQAQPHRNAEYHLEQFRNEYHQYAFYSSRKKRSEKSNLESVMDQLDRFYIAKKLQLSCEVFNVQNVMAVEYHVFLLDEILQYLKDHPYKETPSVAVYLQILKTLREFEQEENFSELLRLLRLHEKRFAKQELRDMYQYALNYCIKKINLGNANYQKNLFDIFKIILKNGVLTHSGSISQWDFKNITTVSLRQKDYDWARGFIDKYESYLAPEERENARSYNLANYHFHKGEWGEALSMLQKVSFTDPYYQLDTRSMMLKIYFEMKEHDVFFYHVTAFLTYLRRNTKISEYQKTIYTNLVKLTSKVMRAGRDKRRLQALQKQIEQIKQIADINWLRKKVTEILES